MALQNFVDKLGPVVSATWLNTVDILKETIFGNATTKEQARANLTADLPLEIGNGGTGQRTEADLIAWIRSGLTFGMSGGFTATLTGVAETVTGTAYWNLSDHTACVWFPGLTGTSNSSAATITGLATYVYPDRTQYVAALVENDGALTWGVAEISSTGTITLYPTPAMGSFVGSGTKGLHSTTVVFSLL